MGRRSRQNHRRRQARAPNVKFDPLADRGEVPPANNYVPAGVRTVNVEIWREYAYRTGISTSDEPRARQKAFKEGSETLIAAKMVAVWEPHVWMTKA